MSVRLHITRLPIDGFFMKFDSIFRESVEKIQVSLNPLRMSTLRDDLYPCVIISR